MGAGRVILSEQKLNLVLDRLAHQLIEHHGDFRNSCLIGIQPRGTVLLERIIKRLKAIAPNNSITYGLLDITFHRDDFRTRHEPLKASFTKMDFLVDNRKVILVDDVLYTGRTIQAAISALQHYRRAEKIELLVLIDRAVNRDLPTHQIIRDAVDPFIRLCQSRWEVSGSKSDLSAKGLKVDGDPTDKTSLGQSSPNTDPFDPTLRN